MASTTAAKKEIIDYLWDWADTRGDWAKLLVQLVVTTESQLEDDDRKKVFDHFLDSLRPAAGKKMPPVDVRKPLYRPTSSVVELSALKGIAGVNRLAKNQVLKFSKSLTAVYGENGTGKTGYGRILKMLGFSYDPRNVILPNVYGNAEPKAAVIEFSVNGHPSVFNWNGRNADPDLAKMSVFNNQCVQLTLSDRQLIVSPIGFHLFALVTAELTTLTGLLKEKIDAHPTLIPWLESLHEGSPQYTFVQSLHAKSSETQLATLGDWTKDHQAQLAQKQKELEQLNQDLLTTRLDNGRAQLTELAAMKEKIQWAQTNVSERQVKELVEINNKIAALETRTQSGLKEIAEGRGVPLYETPAFKQFLQAADNYLQLLDHERYPEPGDVCLYCRQPLEQSGQELLAHYKRLLNDTTERDKRQLIEQRQALLQLVGAAKVDLAFHHPIFGVKEDGSAVQPQQLSLYSERLAQQKLTFEQNRVTVETIVEVDYSGLLLVLQERYTKIQEEINTIKVSLASIREMATAIKASIAVLEDRAFLHGKLEEVRTALKNHKVVDMLNAKMGEFATAPLSRKTSEARDQLLKQDFETLFKRELAALRKPDLPVQLSFGTERGNSKLSQRVSAHMVSDVLSDGEQKAIALAEFLTELQLDPMRAPVIFDDPVNSLDHRIIDEVAKRLIELSRTRQTVIFTHSILLLNSLKQQAELETNKKAGFQFYSLRNNFGETGILGDAEDMNSITYFIGKVNEIVSGSRRDMEEARLAREGYGHLRAAIEVSVEQEIFQKTILRYRKGVAFPSLLRVKGSKIDECKDVLNNIYEKCCVSIDGHSSPMELHTTPTVAELKTDRDAFLAIRKNFVTG